MPRWTKIIDGEGNSYLELDEGKVIMIFPEHTKIHKGELFSAFHKATLVASASISIQVKTGSKEVHFKPVDFSSDAEKFTVEIYENPTLTDGSAAVNIINRNRTSSNTAETMIYSDPTVTDNGTKIDEYHIGSSVGQKESGGDIITGGNEIVFAPNTNYLIVITNNGSAEASILAKFFFYEEA